MWTYQEELTPSEAHPGASFGHAVAIDGERVIVGEPRYGRLTGRAWTFVRDRGHWSEEEPLVCEELRHSCGVAVALDGQVAVVGGSGGASVFLRKETWGLVTTLDAGVPDLPSRFGHAVAVSGDVIVVGAPCAPFEQGCGPGAVIVFERAGRSPEWVRVATLRSEVDGRGFGSSVAVEGGTLVVGTGQGPAHVFRREPRRWVLDAVLIPGREVAISEGTIAVASPGIGMEDAAGWVVLYGRDRDRWSERAWIIDEDGTAGTQVALFGDLLAVGSQLWAPSAAGEAWTPVGRLPAGEIALSGGTAVIGGGGHALVFVAPSRPAPEMEAQDP
jgi:hypothetical protein